MAFLHSYFLSKWIDELDSAHCGKIRGRIEVDPRWTTICTILFTYYYNLTPNDRNLEWDQKRNLFSGLTDMETPHEP